MIDIGRICTKTAGRDAGKTCVVVDVYEKGIVLIDGETRRRRCNVRHLFPIAKTLDIKKGSSHEDVLVAFEKLSGKKEGKKAIPEKPRKQKPAKAE